MLLPAASTNLKAMFNEAQGTAKALGVVFQLGEVKAANPDFEGAFRYMIKDGIGGLVTEGPPLISFHREKILLLAERLRIPAIHTSQIWEDAGGLMSYGPNLAEPYRQVATYVDKIFKGTEPATDRSTDQCNTSSLSIAKPPSKSA